ncbi:hemopexin repeat-containing protein [Nitrosospira sp. Is2]|uniref:hemopexin repeat-containing protein n=1 Tax=Nitrosospira sp. Is2 TaxID=3080532 RepID=UPI002955D42C|nr:hemopexin repeat-containing protein [Nitrosospira sp. Is2]WON74465.1 hemopexin repeat-containing protein [Nitrosospira sp. Is2]
MTIIDSAIMWPNGKIYFFSGSQYYGYDIAADKVDPGYPQPIKGNWPGLDNASVGGIQGAIVWPNGKAYFFSRDQYYSYDIATNRVDPGFPMPTNLNWRGVLAGPQLDYRIDAAIMWPDGKVYLFQYDRYYRYDIGANKVDPGYPALIQGNWPGLWVTGQPFTAAFVWPGQLKAYFFQKTVYFRYDIASNAVDPGYPLSIQGNWPGL